MWVSRIRDAVSWQIPFFKEKTHIQQSEQEWKSQPVWGAHLRAHLPLGEHFPWVLCCQLLSPWEQNVDNTPTMGHHPPDTHQDVDRQPRSSCVSFRWFPLSSDNYVAISILYHFLLTLDTMLRYSLTLSPELLNLHLLIMTFQALVQPALQKSPNILVSGHISVQTKLGPWALLQHLLTQQFISEPSKSWAVGWECCVLTRTNV